MYCYKNINFLNKISITNKTQISHHEEANYFIDVNDAF